MYIKNIIISGFRSYREQSFSTDGLSRGTNVIVGKNGSGKSNFFEAVQFVLNEKYSTLHADQRKALFHVGSGRPSLSIFVEIVFDNSDGRLAIPGRPEVAEVRIRRTVGLKQDEFRVNDQKYSSSEVHQLLESAGFSSSNPYYIVEQGKIVHLASMSEEDRYLLIKDVAGTKVYEARRGESEQILAGTKAKQAQIDESIGELGRRLQDLEVESAELKQYQETEQEKKCVEFAIFNAELETAKESLTRIDKEWSSNVATFHKNQDKAAASEEEVRTFSQRIEDVATQVARLEAEKKSVEEELSALTSRQAIVELDVNDAAGKRSRNERERDALLKELRELEAAQKRNATDADKKRASLEQQDKSGRAKLSAVEDQRRTLERMQEKRNRTKLFKNKQERDAWLRQQSTLNKDAASKAEQELQSIAKEIKGVEQSIQDLASEVSKTSVSNDGVEKEIATREKAIATTRTKRDQLNQERRALWQSVHEQETVLQRAEEGAQSARHQWDRVVRQDIRQGLQSLREILESSKDASLTAAVHGPLIDLISVTDGYSTAVEIASGNTLFNVVVDTFDVSASLLAEMNKRHKPGRISFFPLDTCKGTAKSIPTTAQSSPLLSKIKANKKFSGVLAEVFGRTAVVADLSMGAKLVKELDCDVITVDGDQLGRKGGITGGFIDKKNLKLPSYLREKELAQKVSTEKKKLDQLCQSVATVEQKITEVLNELEALRNQNISTEREADAKLREARSLQERRSQLLNQKASLVARKQSLEDSAATAHKAIREMEKELKEDFTSSWSAKDESSMEKLAEDLARLRVESAAAQTQTLQLATEVRLLEDTFRHLERRMALVSDRLQELGWSKQTNMGSEKEQAAVKEEYDMLAQRLQTVEVSIEAENKQREKLQTELDNITSSRLSSARHLQKHQDALDQTQMHRSLLIQRRDDAVQKVRKLGVLPANAQKYKSYSIGKLMFRLKQLNDALNSLSHVNWKALDQHSKLRDTMKDLQSQRDTLNKELDRIHELMDHLDKKKDEAIERTYKQVQYQFEEVFKQLVDTEGSSAELQLVAAPPQRGSKQGKASDEDPYSGARIRVSFGLGNPVSNLEQLSGGQKSLVALALIFAIQRCDPAPFYLFDEIDAALDAEYRTAVGKMISLQSQECQFLVASFKTEMLEIADLVLGIFFHNKVSRIQRITKEEGVKLLRQAALEDRKRSREEEEAETADEAQFA